LLIRHIKALILCFNELIKEFLAISAVWTTPDDGARMCVGGGRSPGAAVAAAP
jgi:hypothetical protein